MTNTHPMIEKLTQVAAESLFGGYSAEQGENSPSHEARLAVIAVLRALREPDEGMGVAGVRAGWANDDREAAGEIDWCSEQHLCAKFTAMISSILPEEKEG